MLITRLVADGKTKTKIYLDEAYAGWIYNRQLCTYDLGEDAEITSDRWQAIVETEILPRGKKKALDLLLFQERAEKELEGKLTDNGYTEDQVEAIMAYVHKYPYLDDVRYACHMFRAELGRKSARQVRFSLSQKGVSEADIEAGYEQYLEDLAEETGEREDAENPEKTAIRAFVEKKIRGKEDLSKEDWMKVFQSLARKGYEFDCIKQVMSEYRAELE